MRIRSNPVRAISFRLDPATLEALSRLESLLKGRDRSAIIRDSIMAYERQMLMGQIVAACRVHGAESERVVDDFESAGDGLPD